VKCLNCGFEQKKPGRSRSKNQNDYFHGVILPILSEFTGYEQKDMKGVVKFRFGIKSTAELSTAEFEKFMSDIRRWAGDKDSDLNNGETSCYIPEPNEQLQGAA